MPISKNKFSYTLDLEEMMEELNVKPSNRKTAAEAVGLMLVDSIGSSLDLQQSPVAGGSYKKGLSKEYAIKKRAAGKGSSADLQLSGDMLGNLKIDATKKKIKLSLTDGTQKKKAFNHNTGDTLPVRKFMPDDSRDEVFKKKITKRITGILESFSESDDGKGDDKEL